MIPTDRPSEEECQGCFRPVSACHGYGDCVPRIRKELEREKAAREKAEAKLANSEWGEVARVVLRKIEEIEFKAGRSIASPFMDNNLPDTTPQDRIISLVREDFKKFRDDYSLMAAWLAWHFKSPHVAPIHLMAPILEALKEPQ